MLFERREDHRASINESNIHLIRHIYVRFNPSCSCTEKVLLTSPGFEQYSAVVKILALSSSVHHGFGGNQDIYIGEARLRRDTDPQLIRLIDRYPNYEVGLRHSILAQHRSLRMKVVRNEGCDQAAKNVFLSQSEADLFSDTLRGSLSQSPHEIVPCFLIRHDATRLAK